MNQALKRTTQGTSGMFLVSKPVRRVEAEPELREGSTGQIVNRRSPVVLERVWAVAAADVPAEPTSTKHEVKPAVELAFYRKYTESLLRRYLRLSMQAGRVPSLMSREIFRGHVTHYRVHGLEDVVIFCHDMEQRLARLNYTEQQLIKRLVLQQYTRGEAAGMLGMSLSNLLQRYGQAVDRLTGMLLEAGLLNPLE